MSYAADFVLSQDSTFQSRIQMAMVKAAIAIGNAAPTTDAIIDGKRNSLTTAVLNNPNTFVARFTVAAIEAASLVSGSTDAQIDAAISSIWSEMAGVTTRD
jgi:hypothetical protein